MIIRNLRFLGTVMACLFAGATYAETTCTFTNIGAETTEGAGRTTAGIQFILSDDPWSGPEEETEEEAPWTCAYQTDILTDNENWCFPEQHTLDLFTLLHCSGDTVGQGVWGVITNAEGITLGAAYAEALTEPGALEFNFAGSSITLNAYESYTLNFVSDADMQAYGITLGESFSLTTSDIFVHWAAIEEIEEEGETWTNQYDSNEYLSYQESEAVGSLAPAVLIATHEVPEPSTATLGLATLAMLCARRRRKA